MVGVGVAIFVGMVGVIVGITIVGVGEGVIVAVGTGERVGG